MAPLFHRAAITNYTQVLSPPTTASLKTEQVHILEGKRQRKR